MTTTRLSLAALGVTALLTATLSSSWAGPAAPARHRLPDFDPAAFAHPVGNPYFPLTPGLVTRLRGVDGDEHFREKVRVTNRTRLIAGVTATVVRDVVRRPDGSLAETTDDWYANDDLGNVWYLGEDTATYENGHVVDREGSWEAGKHGADPGIIMPHDPEPSTADFMEHAKGVAEDQAWVVQTLRHVTTPGGRFGDIVRTFEWSRLEPDVISQKLYAAGIGIVDEHDVAGGDEHFWVVSRHRR